MQVKKKIVDAKVVLRAKAVVLLMSQQRGEQPTSQPASQSFPFSSRCRSWLVKAQQGWPRAVRVFSALRRHIHRLCIGVNKREQRNSPLWTFFFLEFLVDG